jgi:hypothetical protein
MPSAEELFNAKLREAAVLASNTSFTKWLVEQTTPTGSSGASAANMITDLKVLLNAVGRGENSRFFFIVSGDDAVGMATIINAGGQLQFPAFNITGGGTVLPGVTGLVCNELPAGTAVMVDAGGLMLADLGFVPDIARNATLIMNTAPDSPEVAATVTQNLWQANKVALRVERQFGFALARSNAIASLSGVNY